MKKFFKVVIILVMVVILGIDFYGLWKYKLSGKKYVLETASDDVGGEESDVGGEEEIEYEELTSTTLVSIDKLFIKNIEENEDGTYTIKGMVVRPVEISKDDYTSLRSGNEVEILGVSYTRKPSRTGYMKLESTDENAKDYYIKQDSVSGKYILKDSSNDASVYEKTEKYVSMTVEADLVFVTSKNNKSTTSTVADVAEAHKDLKEPEEETSEIDVCVLTFNRSGECSKITEYCM